MRKLLKRVGLGLLKPYLAQLNYRLHPERLLENPFVTAKILRPLESDKGFYKVPSAKRQASGNLPVPPVELWEGYGRTEEEYLASGREHVANMLEILRKAGAAPEAFARVLEFGCAAARMLRCFAHRPVPSEIWGADIKAQTINWCQQNLTPPLNFVATTTFPHLPFEDNYFDLVFAGSVFSHIDDLPDAWFLELRRVARKEGYIYITIHDKHSVEQILAQNQASRDVSWLTEALRKFDLETSVLSGDFDCFSFKSGDWGGFPVAQVFYDVKYLERKWAAPVAKLVSVKQDAYGYQTGLLFQKL